MRRQYLIVLLLAACGDDASDLPADASFVDAPLEMLADAAPPDGDPSLLSSTGLYADIDSQELAAGLIAFEPRFQLWSDGAEKRRFLRLPPGTELDTSDPVHFALPVGGRVWKEFAAPDGTLLETRMITRVSPDEVEFAAFVWREDASDAVLAPDGAEDVNGTQHDVPSNKRCNTCHNGEPGRVLGLSAVQLGDSLAAHYSTPLPAFSLPGDETELLALGSLHANCGHCHNPRGTSWPDVAMSLQLVPGEATVEDTSIYRDLVGVALFRYVEDGYALRIDPGHPETSAVIHRMALRTQGDAMPPIASEQPDEAGIAAVAAWISSLPALP